MSFLRMILPLSILFVFGSSEAAFAEIKPSTKLKDLRTNSFLAGNLFGPQGLGNDYIHFTKRLTFAPNHDEVVSGRCLFSISWGDKFHDDTLITGRNYGLDSLEIVENIFDHHKTLFLRMANVYRNPGTIWVNCEGMTEENTVEEFENASDRVIKFKSALSIIGI